MSDISFKDIIAQQDLVETTHIYQRSAFILREGQYDDRIYLIESGSVRVYIIDGDEERIVRLGYSGDTIVALDTYLSHRPTVFYIQAIKKSVVHIIRRAHVEEVLRHSPNALAVWSHTLSQLVLQQVEREIDLLTMSPRQRYERVLARSPRLFQEIPLKYIAHYLRMSAETLSRMRHATT